MHNLCHANTVIHHQHKSTFLNVTLLSAGHSCSWFEQIRNPFIQEWLKPSLDETDPIIIFFKRFVKSQIGTCISLNCNNMYLPLDWNVALDLNKIECFTYGWYEESSAKIDPVWGLKNMLICRKYICIIKSVSPLGEIIDHSFEQTWILLAQGYFVQCGWNWHNGSGIKMECAKFTCRHLTAGN